MTSGVGTVTRRGPYAMGLMSVLATVAMLFAAFTAALLVRRTGSDWTPVELPRIVWLNTIALVASSGALEIARSAARRGFDRQLVGWSTAAGVLGGAFLIGQIGAWQLLAAQGVLLLTSPHAAFFYMLTAVHGAHVLGGLAVLGTVALRAGRGRYSREHHAGVTHAAIYWHFVGVVWLYLLAALSLL